MTLDVLLKFQTGSSIIWTFFYHLVTDCLAYYIITLVTYELQLPLMCSFGKNKNLIVGFPMYGLVMLSRAPLDTTLV